METKFSNFTVNSYSIFRALINNTNDYIYIWDYHSGSYLVSDNFAEDFCVSPQGENFIDVWKSFVHEHDFKRIKESIDFSIQEKKETLRVEYQAKNKNEQSVWISDKSTIFYNQETCRAEVIIGIMHNLSFDGQVDSITGLLMHNKCKEIFELLKNHKFDNFGSFMLMGIDDFTAVNTLNNHTFGDMVLRTTAQDLLAIFPENISLYRYDGDQFLVAADKMSEHDLREVYNQIKKYTSHSHNVSDKSYRFTISAGIVTYPRDGMIWTDLEKELSIALRKAKDIGKNQCVVFKKEMLEEKIQEQSLGYYLSDSIEHGFKGFGVVFQPICHTQNLKVKGAEALLRFTTKDNDMIGPDHFIPLLEQSQLIVPVGLWVLEEAIKVCKKWVPYIEDFVMNVNVSYIQLRDGAFCDTVERLLRKYDLDVKHLTLELTESYFVTDAVHIDMTIKRLKALHINIAMDDFGTGYSSLARLSEFNVDIVKVDKSLIQSFHRRKYNRDFVDSVVRLCHKVGMKVCAEGVETKEEQESVFMLNIDFVQGYYISKPIEENEFFLSFVQNSDRNINLVVAPSVELRHDQLISDKDVLIAMMDATPLALNFWNRKAEIIACNQEVLKLFDAKDFNEFKEFFFEFSPTHQLNGYNSKDRAMELINQAFDGQDVRTFWEHCKRDGEVIPTEVTIVRIPYMNDYIAASYTRDMREQITMKGKIEEFNLRLRALLDATPLCLNLWDKQLQNIMCNQEAIHLFGVKNKKEYLERFFELSPIYQPDGSLSSHKAVQYIEEAFEKGYVCFEWMHCNLIGEEIPAEITLVKIEGLGEDGSDLVAGYTRDIRGQVEANRLQNAINIRTGAVLDATPLSCLLFNDKLDIIDCNQVAVDLFEADDKYEVMNNFDSFMPLKQPSGENSLLKKDEIFRDLFVNNKETFEWVYLNKSMEEVPCEVSIVRITLEDESIIVAYSRDLRELHHTLELNDRLSKMAYYDLLTGVTSRARLMEKIKIQFALNAPLALVIFDIDYFKTINDSYGHVAGDMVLKRVARRIDKSIPNTAILGRYGGDEFIIQIIDMDKEQIDHLLEHIVKDIANIKFFYNGTTFHTSISMGTSFRLISDDNYYQVLNRADKALYKAKEMGRNCSVII